VSDLARFQREAEVLASLNNPNIAAIHGLEESTGVKALVMELVEGETLADRMRAPRFRSTRRCPSPGRSPKRWRQRTSKASSIAT
jgi:serine/threonine protein kinase